MMGDNIISCQNEDIYSDLNDTDNLFRDPRVRTSKKVKNTILLEEDKNSESLSLLSNAVRNAIQRQSSIAENVFNVVSNRAMLDTEMWKSEMALYDDLVTAEVKEREEKLKRAIKYEELCEEVGNLKCLIREKDARISHLELENTNLKRNICSLYKTAKSEIDRKDSLLMEVNRKLDIIKYSKNIPAKFLNDNQNKHLAETTSETIKSSSHCSKKQLLSKTIPVSSSSDNRSKSFAEGTKSISHHSNREYKTRNWRYKGKNEGQRESRYNRSSPFTRSNAYTRNSPFKRRKDYHQRRESPYKLRSRDLKYKKEDTLLKDKRKERKLNVDRKSTSKNKECTNQNETINLKLKEKTFDQDKSLSDQKQITSSDKLCHKSKSNSRKSLELSHQESHSKEKSDTECYAPEQQDINNSDIPGLEHEQTTCSKKEQIKNPGNSQNVFNADKNDSDFISGKKLSCSENEHGSVIANRTQEVNQSFMEVDKVHDTISISNQNNDIENYSNSQNQNKLKCHQNDQDCDELGIKQLLNSKDFNENRLEFQYTNKLKPDQNDDDQASIIVNKVTEADRNEMEIEDLHSPFSSVHENKGTKSSVNFEQKHFEIFQDMTTTNALFFGLLPTDIRQSFMLYEQNQITSMNRLKQSFVNYYFKHSEMMASYLGDLSSNQLQEDTSEGLSTKIQNSSSKKDTDSPLFFFEHNCDKNISSNNLNTDHVLPAQEINESGQNISPIDNIIPEENGSVCNDTVSALKEKSKSICSQDDECNTDSTKEIPTIYREIFNKSRQNASNMIENKSICKNSSPAKNCDPQSVNPIPSQNIDCFNASLENNKDKHSSQGLYVQQIFKIIENTSNLANNSPSKNCVPESVKPILSQSTSCTNAPFLGNNENIDCSKAHRVSDVIENIISDIGNKSPPAGNGDPESISLNISENIDSDNASLSENNKNTDSPKEIYVRRDKKFVSSESHHPSYSSVYYRRQLLKLALEEKRTKGLTKTTKEDIAKLYKFRNGKKSIIVKKKKLAN